ncbi:MAG: hypothetical protein WAT72_04275 [Microgenomates group bacterium]
MVERGTTTFREGQFSKLQAALFIRAVYLLGQLPPIVDDSKPKNHTYRPVFRYCARKK